MEIVCVVEGHGEVQALPVLIRRIAPAVRARTLRVTKDRLLKRGELERTIDTAGELLSDADGAILVVLDADKDCPAVLGPAVLARSCKARSDRRILVAIAKAEFESWFLAAARSLGGKRGLPLNLTPPPYPEGVRGAKEWLASRMPRGYSETIDQRRSRNCSISAMPVRTARGSAGSKHACGSLRVSAEDEPAAAVIDLRVARRLGR